ncbi:MAG: phytase [Fimbriimonadaceae bacterium]
MRRFGLWLVGLSLVGCAGTGSSPLDNQPGTRFNSAGANSAGGRGTATSVIALKPAVTTEAVSADADDPAIWVNRIDPAKSLILGTDKVEVTGGLYAFGLDGKTVQKVSDLDRPNNVDVEYDFKLGDKNTDLAVLTERKKGRLKIYSIDQSSGKLTDVSGETAILGEAVGDAKEPMGVGLYRNPDGEVFAIVAPKTGGKSNYLAQYRLIARDGKVDLKLVRRFGEFSGVTDKGEGEIEAIVVDDALGVVYYSDELKGIRKYWADPAKGSAEIAFFGTDKYMADREGLAIYATGEKDGFLLSVDQVEKKSRIFVYTRTGASEKEMANKILKVVETPADSTDGMDATNRDLGPQFPEGIVVMMDSMNKRFLIFDWRDINQQLTVR